MSELSEKTTFTMSEAAQLLSCHKETLRRAIARGELQAARLGKGYRISRLDLETYWAARGGGELFAKKEDVSPPAPKSTPRAAKKKFPPQLVLPGTGQEVIDGQ